ncbi:MAG: KR domain-containing protein, partial [Desulfobacterales bacterium]|nr:KR domain-containing protein [Desulfobacterales bacterium]
AGSEHTGGQATGWTGQGLSPDEQALMTAGDRWLAGADIDPDTLYSDHTARRIPLPTYPFERQRCWVDPQNVREDTGQEPAKKEDISDWFYVPSWKRLPHPVEAGPVFGTVLLFMDDDGDGRQIAEYLAQRLSKDVRVVVVRPGRGFEKPDDSTYRIDPDAPGEYNTLMADLWESRIWPDTILHLWSLTRRRFTDVAQMDNGLSMGCHSLSFLVKAVGEVGQRAPLGLTVVTNGTQQVTGEERLDPVKAAILGPAKVIPLEYPYIDCRTIDMVLPQEAAPPESITARAEQLYQTLRADVREPVVALRGAFGWTPAMEPLPMKAPEKTPVSLKNNGVYLITGGLGGIGLTLAADIARSVSPTLILIGRSDFPSRDRWEDWMLRHGETDSVSIKIQAIREMEASGATVYPVRADVAEPVQIREILHWVSGEFGRVDGVIHSAGRPDFSGMIQTRSKADDEAVMAPKIRGTILLADYFKNAGPDFFILCSSLSTVVYDTQFGQSAYVAANEFLDVFAAQRFASGDTAFVSVNWDTWREVGMAVNAVRQKGVDEKVLEEGMLPHEGADVFRRILAHGAAPRMVVSTRDPGRYNSAASHPVASHTGVHNGHTPGKTASNDARRPNNVTETLNDIWRECFGVEDIGADEDFFAMGGDSLQGTRVMSRITELLGIDLAVDVLFEHPTVQSLADYIAGLSEETTAPEKRAGATAGEERKVISL